MKIIPYGRQSISEDDIQAVVQVLRSDYLTQGPKINEFEGAFAEYIGCQYAVAVANGTAALHLSAMAMDVKPGNKIITTPITFAASANCIRYCGGEIVFADIERDTYLLDIQKVRKLLRDSPRGTYKGIIPVDFSGRAVNMEAYRELADEYDLWLIEDSCHAPGALFRGNNGIKYHCGDGGFAELSIFSFHPVKHIACGEGGMITTNRKDLYEKLQLLRTHGINRNAYLFENSIELAAGQRNSGQYPGWYMEMQELGYNYRLTDFQAALGISQLKKAEEGLKRRLQIASRYNEVFSKEQKILGHSGLIEGHAYHLYIVEIADRLGLYNYLRKNGILVQVHYIPVHLMPYYQKRGWKQGDLPNAEEYYKSCLSLPMFPSLTEDDQEFVIRKVIEFINE